MSLIFRSLIKKIGSGPHTSEALTRDEAAQATLMMLTQAATPAQIGAFMIAHRLKRPTGEEMAGLLDAYKALGPTIPTRQDGQVPMVFGMPYDGRSRCAPIFPLVALVLAAAGQPVFTQGGRTMPTKYGVTQVELWAGLGVEWRSRSLGWLSQVFEAERIGVFYQPDHFPEAEVMVDYRDQLGKRPPLATLELFWTPYRGPAHGVSGFVHPPTEGMISAALLGHGVEQFTLVKGLEGGCDLPRDRTGILSLHRAGKTERLLLHPSDYGCQGREVVYSDLETWTAQALGVLAGETSELGQATVWNAGFYLWLAGKVETIEAGLELAGQLIRDGQALAQLEQLKAAAVAGTIEAVPTMPVAASVTEG
jgi:anthranilate phosphoribosyltransferase